MEKAVVGQSHGKRLKCPDCKSLKLMARHPGGLIEPLVIWLTGIRKYRCALCGSTFRAHGSRTATRHKTVPLTANSAH